MRWWTYSLSYKVTESEVAQSCLTLCDPWMVAHQAPPSVGLSRQEYWSGLPLPSDYFTLCNHTSQNLLPYFILPSPTNGEGDGTHSSTLAWKIQWMEEPGRLQCMGLQTAGHDWVTSLSLFTFMHWRRKWQPTPVFLPGESQGRGSLVGCCLWGRTELDTTEAT